MLASGMMSSALESSIWEQITGMPSVSTMSPMQEAIDMVETAALVPLVLQVFAGGVLLGTIGAAGLILLTTMMYIFVIEDVKTNVDLWYAYLEGDEAAGEQLIYNAGFNVIFTVSITAAFKGLNILADSALRNYATEYITDLIGEEAAERFVKGVKSPGNVTKAVKALQKSGISDDAIRKIVTEVGEDGLIKAGRLAKQGMPANVVEALVDTPNVFSSYDEEMLMMLKHSAKSSDEIASMITNHGKDAIALYILYGDNVVEPILKYGDSAIDGIRRYGDDYLMLYDSFGDEFAKDYAKHNDMAVDAYATYGNNAYKVLDDDPSTVPEGGLEAVSKPSSRTLRKNLVESGIEEPDYPHAAHHIVAGTSKKAEEARAILLKYGIDINDAANGVFLPTVKGVSEGAYHPSLHTNEYYDEVNRLLSKATSKEDVIDILEIIGMELSNGTFMQ